MSCHGHPACSMYGRLVNIDVNQFQWCQTTKTLVHRYHGEIRCGSPLDTCASPRAAETWHITHVISKITYKLELPRHSRTDLILPHLTPCQAQLHHRRHPSPQPVMSTGEPASNSKFQSTEQQNSQPLQTHVHPNTDLLNYTHSLTVHYTHWVVYASHYQAFCLLIFDPFLVFPTCSPPPWPDLELQVFLP